ncbi:discoidin domain-containing protein [Paenibacillus sp. GCM10023248]|uniref:discoidin domain-containing protein n=1 Tax=unclassified Paenibacillus TaxID=185978 RepID=UPI002378B99C|nr:discoidin domain-containing protein [Paenibacillus sp. MAHUQ-63]MDD9265571.1 discoidin domain-containing protein [Paenibacillus sp. MAHUQ-63]
MGKMCKWYPTRIVALLMALIIAVTFIPVGNVQGAGTLLKTGNYQYSVAPNGGNSPDKGVTGLISSANGVLLDGLTTTYAGFMGNGTGTPGSVQVVFDLLKDYPLDSINVVLNSPNSFWGFKELTVKYRPEASENYYIADKHTRTPIITSTSPSSAWNYSVNIPMSNKTARFIIIDIKRPHDFQHIPLTEVQIYKGTGQEGVNPGPALTSEQMALELNKDTLTAENLLKTGNYFYSHAPNGGSLPDKGMTGLVSSSNGVLLDGSTATYAGFMGSATSPGTVQVVFDLLKDYPLDRINLVLNSPNSAWGFKEFTVKYRPEAVTDYYYIAAKHIRTPGITSTSPSSTWNYAVNIPMSNKTARFIVIDIKRPHAYQHIPLTEIQIYKGTGQEGVNPGPALTAEQMALELKKDGLMADKYGQWVYETWPGKVTSDEQLQQEYTNEANALSDVSLDLTQYDPYGGIKSGGAYTGSGYFRLQQIDNKWWFITPDGYKFILKGVDATSIWEWGYGTPLKKADGTPRGVFEELPDPVTYAPAYVNDANGERVSFIVANVMRKYGSNFESKWEDITKKRLVDWGFNAFSKWTKPTNITFPYINVLQDPGNLRRIQWTYDVFDPQSEAIIESALTPQLDKAKNDPWLIGYTYDNEAGWTTDIVKEVLTYNSTSAAKGAFVNFLAPRYSHDISAVNQLLGTSAASFDELKNSSINIANVPAADVSEFIKLASRTYFSTIRDIIKRHDTNHLFLGASVVPTWRTSLEWDSAAMEFVDAFSVDNYTNDPGWISRYEAFGKPLLNLEYTFSTTQRGLSPVNGATSVASIADRGMAYKSFVESETSHPLFVGSGWFSYFDQAVTWRKDGENYNIGLVNQQDQPYTDMVNIMKTVNAGLENIHANGINLALDRPVTASSSQSASLDAGYAFDGQTTTSWGSNLTDNEWIYTDLGSMKTVSRVKLNWGTAYGKAYKIQVSDNAVDWTDVYSTNAGNGGTDDLSFTEASARYVRMLGIQSGAGGGYSLSELEVYEQSGAPSDEIPPVTTDDAPTDWRSTDVTVSLNAADNQSGVDSTQYRINGGQWLSYDGAFDVSAEGTNTIEYQSKDKAGNLEEIKRVLVKIDKTAPEFQINLNKAVLWPANHELVTVTAETYGAVDGGAGIKSIILQSITSNEPDDGTGDGDTSQDIQHADLDQPDYMFDLRAERSGSGEGRVYTITYIATDYAGNVKQAALKVNVPKNREQG